MRKEKENKEKGKECFKEWKGEEKESKMNEKRM